METLHQGNQLLFTGMLNLNAVVQTPMILHALVAQNRQFWKKVHKIVLKDRKVKLREIADTLKISKGSVFIILHENLSMRKLLSKWVLRLLTPNQKQQRVDDSERCLELFKRDEKNFLHRYVTMNETWIHYYTPESKRSSAEWTAIGESRPQRPKTQKSAGKVMASVF